ncbi:MAG: hypothetical protein JRI23_32410 [Deltaproteobacteria bacterium]|jgi:hypothetical protein|nr:hypothetical protein [Deltaproteobacteria bacterium]MBW2536948.1 hypothetical protein [Deltaproteobacteria bacterium]
MISKSLLGLALVGGVLVLGGCEDPLMGKWKTRRVVVCDQKGSLEFEDGESGKAKIPVDCGVSCRADVTAEEAELGYDFAVKITTPDRCLIEGNPPKTKATYDCKWEKEETRLDCGNFFEWVRDD